MLEMVVDLSCCRMAIASTRTTGATARTPWENPDRGSDTTQCLLIDGPGRPPSLLGRALLRLRSSAPRYNHPRHHPALEESIPWPENSKKSLLPDFGRCRWMNVATLSRMKDWARPGTLLRVSEVVDLTCWFHGSRIWAVIVRANALSSCSQRNFRSIHLGAQAFVLSQQVE